MDTQLNKTIPNKTVAFLVAPRGTEESEFTRPKEALENAGANVAVLSTENGKAQMMNGLDLGNTYRIDRTVDEVSAADFDALVIPGGTAGADTLRLNDDAVRFVRTFFEQKKPVAAICHAPWLLIEADVVKGRTLTSYRSLRTDLTNAGATWVDEPVHVDQGLVTSRTPNDLPAFCDKLIEEVREGKHEKQAMSV